MTNCLIKKLNTTKIHGVETPECSAIYSADSRLFIWIEILLQLGFIWIFQKNTLILEKLNILKAFKKINNFPENSSIEIRARETSFCPLWKILKMRKAYIGLRVSFVVCCSLPLKEYSITLLVSYFLVKFRFFLFLHMCSNNFFVVASSLRRIFHTAQRITNALFLFGSISTYFMCQ